LRKIHAAVPSWSTASASAVVTNQALKWIESVKKSGEQAEGEGDERAHEDGKREPAGRSVGHLRDTAGAAGPVYPE